MKRLFWAFAVITFSLIACSNENEGASFPDENENNAETKTPEEIWAAASDSCISVLIDQFMDKEKGTFWAAVQNKLPSRTQYLYWQQAHAMDVLVYAYERIKDKDPERAATYENYFKLWFENHANNWYDWRAQGDETGFLNEFIDDMAWISSTMLHMTEATGDDTYFNMAKKIYDTHMVTQGKEDEKGWALPWKTTSPADKDTRYICTNAPACVVACKLYMKTKEPKYLEDAQKLYDFITANLMLPDGRVEEPPLTYTQGTFAEAARLLYHITEQRSYLKKAETAVVYTISSSRCVDKGLLRNEGSLDADDGLIFKAVFIPYAVNLVLDESTSYRTREEVRNFLLHNAKTLWFEHMNRDLWPEMYCGPYWGNTYSVKSDEKNGTAYMCAHASGASLLENVTRMLSTR